MEVFEKYELALVTAAGMFVVVSYSATSGANMNNPFQPSGCRYCQRYSRACGRDHSSATRADWSRTWDGYDRPSARSIVLNDARENGWEIHQTVEADMMFKGGYWIVTRWSEDDPQHVLVGATRSVYHSPDAVEVAPHPMGIITAREWLGAK